MKKIRYFLILLLCALPVLFLASCNKSLADEAINRITTTQDKKDDVKADFVVNAFIIYQGKTYDVTWESNNPVAKIGTELVNQSGKADSNGAFFLVDIDYANNTEADQKVILTASIVDGKKTAKKNITFIVPKYEQPKGPTTSSITLAETLTVGTAYKLAFVSTNDSKTYYFTGAMSGYYGATVNEAKNGIDMYVEEVNGGYNLYFSDTSNVKQYINIEVNGAHINFVFKPTATTVWTWNTDLKALVGVSGDKTYFMGTSSTFKTFGMMEISTAANSYVGQLYIYVPGSDDSNDGTQDGSTSSSITLANSLIVGQAYKLGFVSKNDNKTYYFKGTMSGYYGATSNEISEAVDMYVETVAGGYSLYFNDSNNTKQYINIEVNGTHINFVFKPTATTVWTWNTDLKALVGVSGDKTYFMGTSSTYKTFEMRELSKASDSYVGQMYVYVPGSDDSNDGTQTDTPSKEIDLSKYDLITIAKALEIAETAGSTTTTERYYIYGIIKEIKDTSYGSMTITDGTNEIYVYGTYSADGSSRYSVLEYKPVKGDAVVLYANLCTYKGTKEVQSGWIVDYATAPKEEVVLPAAGSEITISQAIQIAEAVGDEVTTSRWVIKGTVATVVNAKFGEMYITDGTNEIYVYGAYSADGTTSYSDLENKPYKGDSITISVNLSVYNGVPQVKSAWIQEFAPNTPDLTKYTETTISAAREAEVGELLIIKGIVSVITYANGYIPDGVILVDCDSSIYVYGRDVAARVSVGNEITVYGEKDFYIADAEVNSANKFGYKGACQLTDVNLLLNDGEENDIDLSFAEEITVKDLMDSSFGDNVTSLVYKASALVLKDEQDGYTNYYIKDLDEKTGSYVYTKCNGGDFGWLDEFDGKICTVYFTALNAKSLNTGCIWRLQPVKVVEENYQFAEETAPSFANRYYAEGQFESIYKIKTQELEDGEEAETIDINVLKTVDISLVNISGISLSYSSSNSNVIVCEDGVLKVIGLGKVDITITASYKTYTDTKVVSIEVVEKPKIETISVRDAIYADEDSKVTVKGIVTNGQQNKNAAFFLSDETGIIAVEFADGSEMTSIKVGHEVIIEGTRSHTLNDGKKTPQIIIKDATILLNNYGSHEHSTASFEEVTFEELIKITTDSERVSTAQGYIVTAKVILVATTFYTNYYLGLNNDKMLQFYGGSGDQFAWLLNDFVNKEVTFEVTLCNWNGKGYRLTIVAIHTADGKIINNYNLK